MNAARWSSRLVVAAMAAGLLAYVTLHSPLRDLLAVWLLGRSGTRQYFAALAHWPPGLTSGIVPALGALIAATGAGAALADRAGLRRFEWALAFGVAAFGSLIVPAAIVGGLGAALGVPLLRPPVGPLVTTIPSLLIVTAAAARGWRPMRPRVPRLRGTALYVTATAVVLLGGSALVAVSQPPTGFDALAYHAPIAVYLWRDGDITSYLARAPGGFAMAHPASAELWFGLLLMAGGERLANLGQLPFAVLGACAVRALARWNGAPAQPAVVAGAAFVLAPIVALQAGMQLNDVAGAALVLSGAALSAAPLRRWTPWRSALMAGALGLAVATKVAVVPAVGAVVIVTLLRWWHDRVAGGESTGRIVVAAALAFSVCVAPWWVRNAARYGNPLYPAALPGLSEGVVIADFGTKDDYFVPGRGAWPLYPLIEPLNDQSGFGALFVVAGVPGLLIAAARRRRVPLALAAAAAALVLPAWWTQTSHDVRFLLVLAGFGFSFLPLTLTLGPASIRRTAGALVVAAAVFTTAATIDQALIPRVGLGLDRAGFYDTLWNVDPVVAGAPENEPLLYQMGYAPLSYAGDYPLLGHGRERKLFTLDADAGTEQIVSTMVAAGVRYAYVPASWSAQAEVEAKYANALFTMARVSEGIEAEGAATQRYLFRLKDGGAAALRSPAPGIAAAESGERLP